MKYLKIICIFLLLILTSCTHKDTEDPQVNGEFLKWAYRQEFHELDLMSKDLTGVPNFEKYLTWTYKYDVWSITLQDNKIKNIPSELFEYFPNLKELNLSYNQIEEITLNNLPLETLLIHKNKINKFNLKWLNKLTDLNIWYNNIKSLKDNKLPNTIQNLELQHNSLEDISILDKLENLITLKLEFNSLQDQDMIVLQNLKNLIFVSIAKNKLSEKLEEWFIDFNKKNSSK